MQWIILEAAINRVMNVNAIFFLSSFSHHLLGTLIIIKLMYLIDEVIKIITISSERCTFTRILGMEEEGESEEMQQKRNVHI